MSCLIEPVCSTHRHSVFTCRTMPARTCEWDHPQCTAEPARVLQMIPVERVAQTLDSTPVIEPHPNKTETSLNIKPDVFKGHLVFENVHFTYPTERQKPVQTASPNLFLILRRFMLAFMC